MNSTVDREKLRKSIKEKIDSEKYNDSVINTPPVFVPARKFLPTPVCPECKNEMKIEMINGELAFICMNMSCKKTIPLHIN